MRIQESLVTFRKPEYTIALCNPSCGNVVLTLNILDREWISAILVHTNDDISQLDSSIIMGVGMSLINLEGAKFVPCVAGIAKLIQ